MDEKKLSGIRLMAKKLGVSTATISRALNPDTSHLVKEARRVEIEELADRMRYRPNPGARLIQRGVTPTIAVLVPGAEDLFFSEFYGRFLGGLINATQDTEFEIRINALKGDETDILSEFRRVGLGSSGLIYAGLPLDAGQIESLENYHSPLIMLSSTLPADMAFRGVRCNVLGIDNYKGAKLAANHIVELGHKKIGVILGSHESRDFYERARGYRYALKRAGIELKESMFFQGSYDHESGRAGCAYFLKQRQRPSALICSSDSIAFGALEYAKELGVSCPRDLSIIGYDDGPWALASSPKLTTVRQPLGQLAQYAIQLLQKQLSDADAVQRAHKELLPRLQIRRTTGTL